MNTSFIETITQSVGHGQSEARHSGSRERASGDNFSTQLERSIERHSDRRESSQMTDGTAGSAQHGRGVERAQAAHARLPARDDMTLANDAANQDELREALLALTGEINAEGDGAANLAGITSIIAGTESDSEDGNALLAMLDGALFTAAEGRRKDDEATIALRDLIRPASGENQDKTGLDRLASLLGTQQSNTQQATNANLQAATNEGNLIGLPLERSALSAEADSGNRLANAAPEAFATAPNAAGPAQPSRADAATLPQLPLQAPITQKAWADEAGNHLSWMVGRGESKAELVLNPPNMGKVSVSLQVNGEQTNAQFVTANQAAREALEQAIPRLREALQHAGINLAQADVNTSSEQQARQGRDDGSAASGRGDNADPAASAAHADGMTQEIPRSPGWRSGLGSIDTFV